MLSDQESQLLIKMLKNILEKEIAFPVEGESKKLNLNSYENRYKFIVDINRGRIKISKCTFQKRYQSDIILLRLDIDGPPHTNPNGKMIECPHLHVYKEGFGLSWAYPIPKSFTNTNDLMQCLIDFLKHCNVNKLDEFSIQGGIFDDDTSK